MRQYNQSVNAAPGIDAWQPSQRYSSLETDFKTPIAQGCGMGVAGGVFAAAAAFGLLEFLNWLAFLFQVPVHARAFQEHLNYIIAPSLVMGGLAGALFGSYKILRYIEDTRSLLRTVAKEQRQREAPLSSVLINPRRQPETSPQAGLDDRMEAQELVRFREFCERVLRDKKISRRHCCRWSLSTAGQSGQRKVSQNDWQLWRGFWEQAGLLRDDKLLPGLMWDDVLAVFPDLQWIGENCPPSTNQPPTSQPAGEEAGPKRYNLPTIWAENQLKEG